MTDEELLRKTADIALDYLAQLKDRPVAGTVDFSTLLANLGGPLSESGADPSQVLNRLVAGVAPGLVATPGPRYFGFVTGGALPISVAAEWLASVWDQNAFSYVLSPAAAAIEEVVRLWVTELLGLSAEMSMGIVTGGTMANFTALAAARHALLQRVGWNVEAQGLFGAPEITVLTSDESHITIFAALQMLGLGRERVIRIPTDAQGRMRADALQSALEQIQTPILVCAQAGNVNTGAFDPIAEILPLVRHRQGWLHVDGAFGMWVAASERYRDLVQQAEQADSITVDCHKWLNVPYDSGLVLVRDRAAHQAAMTLQAAYYVPSPDTVRENHNWVPESSRRARGFAIYAALSALGKTGVAAIVERCCDLAKRMATHLAANPQVQILNEVVINQVLVRFVPIAGGDADEFTAAVIRQVQKDGTCWAGGTMWQGKHAMRISVSNWSTQEADIDRSAAAILSCLNAVEEV